MKASLSILAILLFATASRAQTETFDYVSYTPPSGWKKEIKSSAVIFSIINNSNKTWCQIAIYKATTSKGNIDQDFESEWKQIVQPLGVTDASQLSDVQDADGWKIKSGAANFTFNNSTASTSLTTISGFNICFSVLGNTNSPDYIQSINDFVSTLSLTKPGITSDASQQTVQTEQTDSSTNSIQQSTPGKKDSYTFNTTNFDDGWVSTVQEDWVEVTKGSVRVLLHYPRQGTIFPADPEPLTNAAWNILVAPRYSSMQNYKTVFPHNDYSSTMYLGMATMVEKGSGKNVFVVFFRRSAGWVEVVTPTAKTFADEFGFDPTTIQWGKTSQYMGGYLVQTNTGAIIDANGNVFDKLDGMLVRNKFAVSANDLYGTGEWDQNFSSNTFWSNVYTGASEGISTYSSSKWFIFGSGQTYKWHLVAVNSYGGISNAAQADGKGTFKSLNNWQLYFTNIEGKPKTYDAYFTAIKGGRVLWMNDAEHPGSGIFSGYSKK